LAKSTRVNQQPNVNNDENNLSSYECSHGRDTKDFQLIMNAVTSPSLLREEDVDRRRVLLGNFYCVDEKTATDMTDRHNS
jgi:hypothetical protein